MQQSLQPFKPSFAQLNIALTVENQIHSEVSVDVDIFKQIIGNLLSNIEKYAANSNEITIKTNRRQGLIVMTIQDQGEGIGNKHREKIFEPFYRINSDLTHASGSGLGLGLARELARLHGGELVLFSATTGCCFQLTIKENNA